MLAVLCSIIVPPLLLRFGLIEFETTSSRLVRIAIASGAAFLTAQLLDITVFNWLRRQSWWRAPIFGTLAGSLIDTAIFFSARLCLAFRISSARTTPSRWNRRLLLGIFSVETARWISWAVGDLSVKLLIAIFALIPYRLIAARWRQPLLA